MASKSENPEVVDMSEEDQALLRLVSSSSTVYYLRCDEHGGAVAVGPQHSPGQ